MAHAEEARRDAGSSFDTSDAPVADAAALSPVVKPYADRLIAGGSLSADISSDAGRNGARTGPLRSLSLEFSGLHVNPTLRVSDSEVPTPGERLDEAGFGIAARLQTDNYGLLGIDAALRWGTDHERGITQAPSRRVTGSFTLSGRDIPIGAGWVGDAAGGLVSTPLVPLGREQARFMLPVGALEGVSLAARKLRLDDDMTARPSERSGGDFNFALGIPGQLGGLRLADFASLGGISITGGGELPLGEGLIGGLQAIGTFGSRDPYRPTGISGSGAGSDPRTSGAAGLLSVARTAGTLRVNANVLVSHLSPGSSGVSDGIGLAGGNAVGGWLDADWRAGRQGHAAGLYYLGPGLAWGTHAFVNNAWGGYYRYNGWTRTWRWYLNIDGAGSVDGSSPSGLVASGELRRQLRPQTAIGAGATLRMTSTAKAGQLRGFVEQQSRFGSTRLEAGWTHGRDGDVLHAALNHDWTLPGWLLADSRISTGFVYDHMVEKPAVPGLQTGWRSSSFGMTLAGSLRLVSRVTLDANVAWNSNAGHGLYGPYLDLGELGGATGFQRSQAFSAMIAVNARLAPRLSLSANLTDTRTDLSWRNSLAGAVTSPLGATAQQLQARAQSRRLFAAYVTLRYALAAGSPPAVLGTRHFAGPGSGDVAGTIFLDGNGNGRQEAGEMGAAGIGVVLDGVLAVRTDLSGRYRFDQVAPGPHRLEVIADALPLPWVIPAAGSATATSSAQSGGIPVGEVEVNLRETTRFDIAARR